MATGDIVILGVIYCIIAVFSGAVWDAQVKESGGNEAIAAGACWPLVLLICFVLGLAPLIRRCVLAAKKSTWREL